MARFHFRWPGRTDPPVLRRARVAQHEVADAGDSEPPLPAGGPGWFDSSWDLHRGLDVREGLPANASVSEWLASTLVELPPLHPTVLTASAQADSAAALAPAPAPMRPVSAQVGDSEGPLTLTPKAPMLEMPMLETPAQALARWQAPESAPLALALC